MIEALTTCVDYDDYLEQSLPWLLRAADRVLVVTSPGDARTKAVCRRHRAEFLATNVFFDDGASFWRARAINAGLAILQKSDWVMLVDADTLMTAPLPAGLSPHCLYTAPRVCLFGSAELDQVKRGLAPRFRPGIVRRGGELWPCGYLQLWHFPSAPLYYPEDCSQNAGWSDLDFAAHWSADCRRLLPDYFVFHLAMPGDEPRVNWEGRRSPRFE